MSATHVSLRRTCCSALLRTVLFTVAVVASLDSHAAQPSRPNILVIMADDLGFSDIAPFGSEISTPHLAALARESMVMTAMYATPMPHTTHAEFLFGVDHHITVDRFSVPGSTPAVSGAAHSGPQPMSLAAVLRNAGYRTYMIGTWDSGNEPHSTPQAQGFDSSHALLSMAGDYFPPDGANVPAAKENFRYLEDGKEVPPPATYITDYWTDKLIEYLQRDRTEDRPFFAYAAYTAPHFPLQAPDEFIARQKGKYAGGYDAVRLARIAAQRKRGIIEADFKAAIPKPESAGYKSWHQLSAAERTIEARRMEVYAAMVENLDWNIGRLLQALKASGRYDNTLIVFTSTNGAAQSVATHRNPAGFDNSLANMGRKNSWIAYSERWVEVSNAPFAGWKAKATEGSITVPTLVRVPGSRHATGVSSVVALIRDLPATFAELAGASVPEAHGGRAVHAYTGRSLRALWDGSATSVYSDRDILIDEHRDEAYVREAEWKAVLISDTAINAFDGADPNNAEYLAAVRAGDMSRAAALRARHPSRWQLYRIRSDRGETTDLASSHPAVLNGLIGHFERYRRQYSAP